jgi:tetratricopeptide (TPR) repeat protein
VRRNAALAWPLAAFVASQAVVLLIFFVNTRLRLPLLFFLTPFAGLAIVEIDRWRRSGKHALWIASATVLALATAFSVARTVPTPRDRVRLAAVLSIQNRLDEGLAALGPALSSDPPYAPAFDQAGWLLQKKRDYRGAVDWYRKALAAELTPGRALQTRTRLAMCLEGAGDTDAAAAEHERAIQDAEANAGTYYERGAFRLRRGDRAGALDDFRRATALDPNWPPPREALRQLTSTLSSAPSAQDRATGAGAQDR